jgi:SMI1 / KNR4 family (SUKH-1)
MNYLTKAKILYTKGLPTNASRVLPCSESEVALLEQELSIKLPEAYREFLLWLGDDAAVYFF